MKLVIHEIETMREIEGEWPNDPCTHRVWTRVNQKVTLIDFLFLFDVVKVTLCRPMEMIFELLLQCIKMREAGCPFARRLLLKNVKIL